jgi:hypothetical protein
MHSELRNSITGTDFVRRLDQRRYEEMKTLVFVLADGIPERLAKIEAAKTLTDIQRVFIEIVDETASPNSKDAGSKDAMAAATL